MALTDIAKLLDETLKSLHLLQERHEGYQKKFDELQSENAKLRKEVADLTTRVAVLEEGRKTTAAEVKLAVTESLSEWKFREMKEKMADLELKAKQVSSSPKED